MATKYAEGVLAVKYRTIDANGHIGGGPMYYIEKGLGRQYRPLAIFFAVAGTICACFGSGTFTQVNAIVEITNAGAQIPVLLHIYRAYGIGCGYYPWRVKKA